MSTFQVYNVSDDEHPVVARSASKVLTKAISSKMDLTSTATKLVSPLAAFRARDEDYDPHKHRNMPNPTTYSETMTNMLKACFGAGMLALPNAMSRLGLVLGIVGVFFLGFFSCYCLQLLIFSQYKLCKEKRVAYMSFPDSMRLAVQAGPPFMRCTAGFFAFSVDIMIIIWQLGVCAIYLVFVGENMKQVMAAYGSYWNIRILIIFQYPVLAAVCMIKDLKKLALVSTFSNFCNFVGVVLVFYYLSCDDLEMNESHYKMKSLMDVPIFIGIVLFAIMAPAVLLALERNMEKPKDFTGWCGIFSIGTMIIVMVYTTMGIFGYLKYGLECAGSITLNLPQNEKKAHVAKTAFAATIYTSFPLQNYAGWETSWLIVQKKISSDHKADLALRLLFATIPFGLALAVPTLGPFIGLMGSLCLTIFGILFPALVHCSICYPMDTEAFNPHEHRRVPHPTTYSETMTHMLKGCLGCGMLAMPNAVSRMGLIAAPLGILGIGIFATYCIQVLVLAQYALCKKLRRGYMAYTRSMHYAVAMGPPCLRSTASCFAGLVDFFLIFWQIGICAIYFVFVAENLKQLIDVFGNTDMNLRLIITYLLPVALALCMVKNLKLMTPISTIANYCVAVGLLFTFFYLIEDDVVITQESFEVKGLIEIPVFIGITLFALEAVGVILALEYNMENPRDFTGFCGLFSVGMAVILAIYVVLGVAGFLKYGQKSEGSLTLNLPQNEKRAQLVKVAFAVAIFLSFPLQNFVAWQICWRLMAKKFNNDVKADYLLRVFLVVLPYVMAVIAPNLGAFMGLMGALCLSMVAIFFPALMDICVFYPDQYGPYSIKLISDIFIMVFGTICCCSGVYTSLLEMYESYS